MSIDATTAAAIAAAVSAVAALVSLLVAVVAVYLQAQSAKPKVHVAVSAAMAAGASLARPVVQITAQNRGVVSVVVDSVGFDLSRGQTAPLVNPHSITGARVIPGPLQPGEAVSVVFGFAELAHMDAEARVRGAFVTTAAGGGYTRRMKRSWIQSWARRAAGWGSS